MQSTLVTSPSMPAYGTGHDAAPAARVGPLVVATMGGTADPVVTAARLLAERLGGAPEVVSVLEPIPVFLPGMGMEPMLPAADAEQRRRLVADVEHALRDAGVGATAWPIDVLHGPAPQAIARVARERDARMIVMGIGRHEPLDRVFGSETTLHTVRAADRPVLAVAPGFAALPRHAVVAIDFSPASVRAAEEALAILAEGGRLSLVHVGPPADVFLRLGHDSGATTYGEAVAELFERFMGVLEVPPGVTVDRVELAGDPAGRVLQYVERMRADLIATGSSGLGFFDRLMVGSVATRLIRRATVSVLAVPRPAAAVAERIERELAGTLETSDAARWPAILEAFSERNVGRPTRLEIDDPSLGAQLQEVGHILLGVAYDRRDERLEITLGPPTGGGRRLTHSIGEVTSIVVITGALQHDVALQARHGQGQTILMFGDDGVDDG